MSIRLSRDCYLRMGTLILSTYRRLLLYDLMARYSVTNMLISNTVCWKIDFLMIKKLLVGRETKKLYSSLSGGRGSMLRLMGEEDYGITHEEGGKCLYCTQYAHWRGKSKKWNSISIIIKLDSDLLRFYDLFSLIHTLRAKWHCKLILSQTIRAITGFFLCWKIGSDEVLKTTNE